MTCSRTGRRPPKTVRVTIDSLAFGGDGVARDPDGRVLFVPGTAPGDEIVARLVEEKKGFARGEVDKLVRPSPSRVAPPCPIFVNDDCGGCQWQHVAIAAQRAAKEDIVRRALRKVAAAEIVDPIRGEPLRGGRNAPWSIETPAPDYGWRRRARMRIRAGVVGYLARRSHRLVDVPRCPQLEPALERAMIAVRGAVARLAGGGELELLLGAGDVVHVVIEGRGARGLDAASLVGQAGIAGVVLRDPDVPGELSIGADLIELEPGFWSRADLFAQVSAPGNAALRRLVREGAGDLSGARVLELFAGSGNFTRDLVAAGAASVVAVEDAAPAAALAPRNLGDAARRVTFRAEPAESAAAALAAVGERFDLVVVDPPRTGFPPGLAASIAQLAPRLIYVSCDPATLARDLAALPHRVSRVTPVDLMPQTYHVEIVTVAMV